MAGVDKKISALPERATVDGTEETVVRVGSLNYKVLISKILAWIKTQLTDYVTLTGSQELTNKTLTSPLVNGVAVTVTGTVINFLANLTGNVQTLLNSITGRLDVLEADSGINAATYPHIFEYEFTTIALQTTEAITQADILTAIGQGIGFYIKPTSIQCQLYLKDGGYQNIALVRGETNVEFSTTTNTSTTTYTCLNTLTLSGILPQKTYLLVASFKLAEIPGI